MKISLLHKERTEMKHIITIELIILLIMILAKSVILRRNGIKALKFGSIDKNALMLILIIGCFVYAALSSVLNLPFPTIARKPFWSNTILNVIAILICTASLVWFGITLKIFGNSFRIGIDEKTDNKLIKNGTFALSRNPVFVAFIAFFIGFFLTYSNMITLTFLILLMIVVHIQILKEEIFLKKHYGKEYNDYFIKVKRYI